MNKDNFTQTGFEDNDETYGVTILQTELSTPD